MWYRSSSGERAQFASVALTWFLAVGLPVMAPTVAAQQGGGGGTIAGRVLSDAQRPVQGAQIGARSGDGTVRGTVADGNGRFRITGLNGAEVGLEVRMLGFRSYAGTARVGDTTVAITLAAAAVALDQMVITGTPGGTQARAIGNEVARVDASNVVRAAPVLSVQQLLGARVSGVVVLPGSGNIGTGSVTRVRGNASLSLSNDPLIYIDGVRVNGAADAGPNIRQGRQVSRLNDLSPEEIESIEVIKGPAAATLYGTEASNGVIQIITKKGAAGTTSFDFMARAGGTWLMNAEGKVPTVYSKDANGQVVGVNLLKHEREQGRPVFRTGPLRGVSGSLRGGNPQARYFLSGEVDGDDGIVTYNWLRRKNVRANVQLLPLQNLDLVSSVGFVRSNTRFAQAAAGWGVWDQLIWGSPSRLTTPTRGMLRATPEAAGEIESLSDIDRFTGGVQASHTPWSWFKHRVTFGTDITNDVNSILFPRNPLGTSYFFGALSLGQKTEERNRSMFTTLDYAATATVELPRALSAQTSVGVQSYLKRIEFMSAVGRQFPAPSVKSIGGAAVTSSSEDMIENKTIGVYVQEQLSLSNRLFLTAALRGDDNSAFGKNYKAAYYPKLSASWVINEEPWWRFGFVNALKLRAALGYAGQQPDVFAAIRLYQPATGPGDISVLTPQTIGNPDLAPEKSREVEAGFDAGLFDDRIALNLTYYDQRRQNAIVQRQVPPSEGFPGFQFVNVGAVSNRGLEIGTSARVLHTEALDWGLDFKIGTNRNKVLSLGGLPPIAISSAQVSREGQPLGAFFYKKVVSAALDATGKATNMMCAGDATTSGQPVACANAPKVYWGTPTPKWEGSVASTVSLGKSLRLYGLVDYRGGFMIENGDIEAMHTTFLNSKTVNEGKDAVLVAYNQLGLINAPGFFNAGFAKLREVSATYDLPVTIARRARASRASFSIAGRNLATLWRAQKAIFGEPIPDPEVRTPAANLSAYVQTVIPPLSQYLATVRLSF